MATFLAGLSLSIMTPFYPTEALTKGVTVSQTGIVLGSVFLASILFTPLCGKYIQILGAAKFLILGSLVVGCGNVAFGFLQNVQSHAIFLTLSILVNVIIAIGGSCVSPAAYTLAGDMVAKQNRGKGIAMAETSFGVGTMFGPTVGGILFDYGGFRLPFLAIGLLMVVVAILSSLFLEESRMEIESGALLRNVTWKEILSAPGVGVSIFALVFAGAGWSWYSASLEPFLKHQYKINASQTGLVFMAFGIAYTLFTPVIGFLIDKGLDGLHSIIVGNFIIFLGFVLIGPIPPLKHLASLEVTVSALGTQGLGSSFSYIGTLIYMMKAATDAGLPDKEQTRGMVSSLWVISDCLGGYVGSSLGSLSYDKYGFEVSSMIFGGIILMSVLMMVLYLATRLALEKMMLMEMSNQAERRGLLKSSQSSYNINYGSKIADV